MEYCRLLYLGRLTALLRQIVGVMLHRRDLHLHVAQATERLPLHVEELGDARLAVEVALVDLRDDLGDT